MLMELLFGRYRQQALGLLLLHPDEAYHVREVARLTGTSAGTLHKELAKLAQAGLLLREEQGNQVRYRANRDCPIFPELAGVFRKTTGLVEVLADALQPLQGRVKLALVFGSVARGEERAGSDVDVLVVGDAGFSEVVKALHPSQETIGREINPVVMAPSEFGKRIAEGDGLLREVLSNPRLFVIGATDDLGKLAGNPAAATLWADARGRAEATRRGRTQSG